MEEEEEEEECVRSFRDEDEMRVFTGASFEVDKTSGVEPTILLYVSIPAICAKVFCCGWKNECGVKGAKMLKFPLSAM